MLSDETREQRICAALDKIKPLIHMDGGNVEFVRCEGTTVYIRLGGACIGCPMSMYTIKVGIESVLKEHVPEITEIVAVN